MLEKLARDKQSSLLRKFVNFKQKSFITLGSGVDVTNFLGDVIYDCFVVS
jgi:hypothetical protein